MKYRNTKI